MLERDTLVAFVEAALLTSRGSLTTATLTDALSEGDAAGPEVGDVEEVLEELKQDWDAAPNRGVRIERVAGGWRCVTPPCYEHAVCCGPQNKDISPGRLVAEVSRLWKREQPSKLWRVRLRPNVR